MKWIRLLAIGGLWAFGLGLSSTGWAREWYFQPSASIQSFYDTNVRMVSDETLANANARGRGFDRDAFGFLTYGSGKFGVHADAYDVGVTATGVIKRYISDLDLDNDNVYVTAASSFKITERQTFALNGRYADDTLLGSVIETTGTSQQNTTRTALSINPQWTYALSELSSVQVDYTHMDTSYGQNGGVGDQRFFDNTRDIGSVDLMHQWLPTLKSHAIFEATLFDIPDTEQTTTNYNFNIGVDYNLSQTWTTSWEVGFRATNTDYIDDLGLTANDNSLGPLFLFKTQKFFEASKLEAGYYRETAARGNGGFSLVDVAYLGYSQKLGDRFEVALKTSYNDVRSLIPAGSQNFTFYSAGASATWLISQQLDLTASHRFRFRESQSSNGTNAESNGFFLTFNYKWDPFSTRKF